MLKGMAAEYARTDFAVGKQNKCLREKEDLTGMVKNKSCIKLICLSNVEKNQSRRLDLLAFWHLLPYISPPDLELKTEVTKSKWGTG